MLSVAFWEMWVLESGGHDRFQAVVPIKMSVPYFYYICFVVKRLENQWNDCSNYITSYSPSMSDNILNFVCFIPANNRNCSYMGMSKTRAASLMKLAISVNTNSSSSGIHHPFFWYKEIKTGKMASEDYFVDISPVLKRDNYRNCGNTNDFLTKSQIVYLV